MPQKLEQQDLELQLEKKQINKDYIIAMDNFFTLSKLIKCLRDLRIRVVGTARFFKKMATSSSQECRI